MMNCIIVDNGGRGHRSLVRLCEQIEDLMVLGLYHNGTDVLKSLRRYKVDLIILDQRDAQVDAIGELGGVSLPPVIVVGSPNPELPELLGTFPADIIAWPMSVARLETALLRARRRRKRFGNERNEPEIVLRLEDRQVRVPYGDILYMKYGEQGGLHVFSLDGEFLLDDSIESVLEGVEDERFFKVNKESLVNVDKITEVNRTSILVGGVELAISRALKTVLKSRIQQRELQNSTEK